MLDEETVRDVRACQIAVGMKRLRQKKRFLLASALQPLASPAKRAKRSTTPGAAGVPCLKSGTLLDYLCVLLATRGLRRTCVGHQPVPSAKRT